MKLYNTLQGIIVESDSSFFKLKTRNWDKLINRNNLFQTLKKQISTLKSDEILRGCIESDVLKPINGQEVWAAGVTYKRSQVARMEESQDASDFYAKVYVADRPEIFFKATASRTVGSGDTVLIRRDSKWNVPEPELTLFITSKGKIVAYTCGNDMSSRDIEGENPLYLPQAKSYDASAALGPCLLVLEKPIDPNTEIELNILRDKKTVFEGKIAINSMKRSHKELVQYLFRETSFPQGVFLMTGTGLVPENNFTLAVGDEVRISIDGIGTLSNIVGQKVM
jgi:2-dehydro-3-deoxy-D-arabinonate dehydratase